MNIRLPKRVCSLDIETISTSFKNPEQSKLILAGVITYTLHRGRYYPCRYKCFQGQGRTRALVLYLKRFRGLIIGHNLFQFDYRVIDGQLARSHERLLNPIYKAFNKRWKAPPRVGLQGVIEKTVDTLVFAYRKKNRVMKHGFGGLSLRDLAHCHPVKSSKGYIGGRISEIWRNGDKQTVIDYNRNDCILTKQLWWTWLKKRDFRIGTIEASDSLDRMISSKKFGRYIAGLEKITESDLLCLIGKKKQFTFSSWKRKIKKDGYILAKRN